MASRHFEWRGNPEFKQSAQDAEYFRHHPPDPPPQAGEGKGGGTLGRDDSPYAILQRPQRTGVTTGGALQVL